MTIFLPELLLFTFSLLMGASSGSLCNQNVGKIVNISQNNTLQFEVITSVNQITVSLPNHVKEFKIEFSDESESFRNNKDHLGMNRVFFVTDLKKQKKVDFGIPIIAKVN